MCQPGLPIFSIPAFFRHGSLRRSQGNSLSFVFAGKGEISGAENCQKSTSIQREKGFVHTLKGKRKPAAGKIGRFFTRFRGKHMTRFADNKRDGYAGSSDWQSAAHSLCLIHFPAEIRGKKFFRRSAPFPVRKKAPGLRPGRANPYHVLSVSGMPYTTPFSPA